MTRQYIAGNAGQIEADLEVITNATTGAVICHPHPLYGGSMEDAVVRCLQAGLSAAGVSTMRFNFRGVGASEGEHDRGRGEADDVITLAAWFAREFGLSRILLAGYSFGASVAWHASADAGAAGLLVVAPPLALMGDAPVPGMPTLVILGEQDQIVDSAGVQAHVKGQAHIRCEVLPGCDHFFMAGSDRITTLARDFASAL